MKTSLQAGFRGPAVINLQIQLKSLGWPLEIDGVFGPITETAVKAFQRREGLIPDGIVGPKTAAALAVAKPLELSKYHFQSEEEIVSRFFAFAGIMVDTPVVYGPGRGLFHEDEWVVTWGPGGLGKKDWAGKVKGPSLHCSSLTNFLAGYLLNLNEDWNHADNIPPITEVLKNEKYSNYFEQIYAGKHKHMSASRLCMLDFPWRTLFFFWSQSTKDKNGKWKWDHHTGVFFFHDGEQYRLAADGYRSSGKGRPYSGTRVSWRKLEPDWQNKDESQYQFFRLCAGNADGSWGTGKEPKKITVER